MSTAPSDPRLAAYGIEGKFPLGNPFAVHYRQQIRQDDKHPFVAQGTQWLKDIHAGSTLIAAPDWNQIMLAAGPAWAAGVLPLCRLIKPIDGQHDFTVGVKALISAGMPAWIQIFNEPSQGVEWNHGVHMNVWAKAWASNAIQVFDLGGWPGLQCLSESELVLAVQALAAQNRTDVLQKTWFAWHGYWENHPINYPYDATNQKDHPGATVYTDDTTWLGALAWIERMKRIIGFSLPIIGAEGGTNIGSSSDSRYPVMTEDIYAGQLVAIYDSFRTGILPNGDPLPDEWFTAGCWWIMADSSSQSFDLWQPSQYPWPTPNLPKVVAAISEVKSFVRQFGGIAPPPVHVCPPNQHWDELTQKCVDDLPPPPPPAGVIVSDVSVPWLTVVQGQSVRVKKVYVYDEAKAQERNGMYWRVETPDGKIADFVEVDLLNGGVARDWSMNGLGMYNMGNNAGFITSKEVGPYTLQCGDAKVVGLGDPDHRHFQFLAVFTVSTSR